VPIRKTVPIGIISIIIFLLIFSIINNVTMRTTIYRSIASRSPVNKDKIVIKINDESIKTLVFLSLHENLSKYKLEKTHKTLLEYTAIEKIKFCPAKSFL